jgi:hypothetical protein
MYALWASGPNNTAPWIAAGSPNVQQQNGSKSLTRRDQKGSQAIDMFLQPLLNSLATTLDIDETSDLYTTTFDALHALTTELSADSSTIASQLSSKVLKSLSQTFSNHPLITKRDVSPAEKARILLSTSIRNSTTGSPIYQTINMTSANSRPGPHQPSQQSFADALAETIAAFITNSATPRSDNPFMKLIKDNKPILASTLRATANTFLNEAVVSLRSGFAVPDWVSIYQTEWCWGTYSGAHGSKNVSGCSDSRSLEALNLAPGLKHTLALMDVQRDTPDRVDLPGGLQRMLDGMMQFVHGVFALDVTLVALTGVVMLLSLANCFAPERLQAWSDFLLVAMCAASAWFILLIAAPYAIFEYLNGLVMPGALGILNVGYQHGWRFVGLHIGAEILTLLSTGWWVMLERRGFRERLLQETEPIVIGRRETMDAFKF